jgi:hypothetical protein
MQVARYTGNSATAHILHILPLMTDLWDTHDLANISCECRSSSDLYCERGTGGKPQALGVYVESG